jgi:glutamyl-tRNA reductase
MTIIVVGLNHKTASIDVRERLAFSNEQAKRFLISLKARFPGGEFVIISTCNRVELYVAFSDSEKDSIENNHIITTDELIDAIGHFTGLNVPEFKDALYIRFDDKAVSHLMTVSASLDSLIVGESQILAQVKESYKLAWDNKATGKVLSRLFHTAFNCAKEIYTATSITSRRVSVAGVAVSLAQKLFSNIENDAITVVGAGEMGELLIQHFQSLHVKNICVINRTESRANKIAHKYNIEPVLWDRLGENFSSADIIVAAATANKILFDKTMFAELMAKRKGRRLLVIDIAVPRNFSPEINALDDVYLYGVDDLAVVVKENMQARQEEIDLANNIIEAAVNDFEDWLEIKDIGPLLGQLREKFHNISQGELETYFKGHTDLSESQKEKIKAVTNRMVNKQLHSLMHTLNTMARKQSSKYVAKLITDIIEHAHREN